MQLSWNRAIRFISADGRVLRGEPILPTADFDIGLAGHEDDLKAKVIVGHDLFDTTGATFVSGEVVKVAKILGPLERNDVPMVRCVGLNYLKHSEY